MYSLQNVLRTILDEKRCHLTVQNSHLLPSRLTADLYTLTHDTLIPHIEIPKQRPVDSLLNPLVEPIFETTFDVKMAKYLIDDMEFGNYFHLNNGLFIHPFIEYVRRGFNQFSSYPLYCISSIDIISESVKTLEDSFIGCTMENIINDLFYIFVRGAEEVVVFTYKFNIKSMITNDLESNLSQLYILAKENSKDLVTTLVEECSNNFRFRYLKHIPYKLNAIPYINLELQTDVTVREKLSRIDLCEHLRTYSNKNIFYGQCVDENFKSSDFRYIFKYHHYPGNVFFIRFKNLKSSNTSRCTFLLRFSDAHVEFDADYDSKKPFNYAFTVVLPNINPKYLCPMKRICRNIFYIHALETTIITQKTLFDYISNDSPEKFHQYTQTATTSESFKEFLKSCFLFKDYETKKMYEHDSIQFTRINMDSVIFFIFTSEKRTTFNLSNFLTHFLECIELSKLSSPEIIAHLNTLLFTLQDTIYTSL